MTMEIQEDIVEFQNLLKQALRPNVRQFLSTHITSLQAKLPKQETVEEPETDPITESKPPAKKSVYTVPIKNYAFDENQHSVKLYVTLTEIETLPLDQITCDFTECSFNLLVRNLKGRNHQFQVKQLCSAIKPGESSFKVRKGEFIVTLKKAEKGQDWKTLTKADKKSQELKNEKYTAAKDEKMDDPQTGIMNLMKKMYDDGDDDMKRMIRKTWHENQDKKGGGMPGMPGMDGL